MCVLLWNRQDVTEDDLRLLFSNAGGTVKAFKFFQYVSNSEISLISPPYSNPSGLWVSCIYSLQCSPWHHRCVSYFPGIVKWLWSRCRLWRRRSRAWSTSTTTTWAATSTWESLSPSPPFKNVTHKPESSVCGGAGRQQPFRPCLDTGGRGGRGRGDHIDWISFVVGVLLILSFLERDWNLWLASCFLKKRKEQLNTLQILDPPSWS